jgi:hypothetical protein
MVAKTDDKVKVKQQLRQSFTGGHSLKNEPVRQELKVQMFHERRRFNHGYLL